MTHQDLIAALDRTLAYYTDEFSPDHEAWELPISAHAMGITPNDLKGIRSLLSAAIGQEGEITPK